MKLDRNTNRGGRGKYALCNMRKMIPLLDAAAPMHRDIEEYSPEVKAFTLLVERGIITLGNETPGDQFFVMKYKDKFTAAGLRGYADAVSREIHKIADKDKRLELGEFCAQMFDECHAAEKLGNRIPD